MSAALFSIENSERRSDDCRKDCCTTLNYMYQIYPPPLRFGGGCWKNGVRTIPRMGEREELELGETYLVFVQADEAFLDIPYHRRRVGLNHLAFHAASRQQVDELTRKLKEKGVRIFYPERHPYAGGKDYYAVYFEDPDRIKIEIVAP